MSAIPCLWQKSAPQSLPTDIWLLGLAEGVNANVNLGQLTSSVVGAVNGLVTGALGSIQVGVGGKRHLLQGEPAF